DAVARAGVDREPMRAIAFEPQVTRRHPRIGHVDAQRTALAPDRSRRATPDLDLIDVRERPARTAARLATGQDEIEMVDARGLRVHRLLHRQRVGVHRGAVLHLDHRAGLDKMRYDMACLLAFLPVSSPRARRTSAICSAR